MQERTEFDAIVHAHGRAVERVCSSILRDEHLGRDAAQETFVRLWRRVEEGRVPEKLVTWLRRVAVTTALDAVRARARRSGRIDPGVNVGALAATRESDVPDLDVPLLRARFERALEQLPAGQRTVFLLRHEGGMSLSEAADALDVALPTVKTQFARAVLALQAKLAPFRPAGGTE